MPPAEKSGAEESIPKKVAHIKSQVKMKNSGK